MNCESAREALLTADPAELRSEGSSERSSELAQHLHECDRCRRLATAMGSDLQVMSRLVEARGARREARALLVIGLPVAAAIVGVFVARHGGADKRTAPVNAPPTNVVSVEVARGQRATVFKTKDPKVTVVWLTPGGADDNP